ncbi:uncharacterized protein LOC108910189 [Anoplophora glabripennis]|uniref:uncharacterized protein LOC108910189 n=1 Tax=Anoplophora glabripennis TaxID=217634 RepID=UPI00087467E0|nr:uncharacterized protein LOC108910189 [Anoplophora glabripennis]
MNNTEYYKSLISDEEVIKALIKESKAREGELLREKTRLRPNLNFFHRTVTNLVTSNKRVSTTKDLTYEESRKPIYNVQRRIKTSRTLIKEIVLSNKIDFVKATGSGRLVENNSNEILQNSMEITKCKDLTPPFKPTQKPPHKARGTIKTPRKLITEMVMSNRTNSVKAADSNTGDPVKATECGGSAQPPESMEVTSEKDLNKYFVRATGVKTNSKWPTQNTAKLKSIVFNININKDSLRRPTKTPEEFLKSEEQSLSVRKSLDGDVISISSSSSTSSESESES